MKKAIDSIAEGNRIAFLLASIVLLILTYPFSETGTVAALLFVVLYLGLTGSSIYMVSHDRPLLIASVLIAVVIAVTGSITIASEFTAPLWIQLSWNAAVLAQLVLILALLVLFIIESEQVTLEVLYASIAIYFIMAALFTVFYIVIESFAPGAFNSSSGAEITWQRLTYFSLVTISTLGYGDIVPVAPAAQSLSAMEASLGTLYIAILIGRFVSLYQNETA
ncbi:MAG: potassium channel family protein [Chloroflexota bacterium]